MLFTKEGIRNESKKKHTSAIDNDYLMQRANTTRCTWGSISGQCKKNLDQQFKIDDVSDIG